MGKFNKRYPIVKRPDSHTPTGQEPRTEQLGSYVTYPIQGFPREINIAAFVIPFITNTATSILIKVMYKINDTTSEPLRSPFLPHEHATTKSFDYGGTHGNPSATLKIKYSPII